LILVSGDIWWYVGHGHMGWSHPPWYRKCSNISKTVEIPTLKPYMSLFLVSRNIWWCIVHDITRWFHPPKTGSVEISWKSLKSPPLNHSLESQRYPAECHAWFGRPYSRPDYCTYYS
jgi:hypothetical protein